MSGVRGKAIVVTGSGHGLGKAYVADLVAAGAHVVVNDVDSAAVRAIVKEARASGGSAIGCELSVVEPEQAVEIVNRCVAAFGRVDGLVNNAGIRYECPSWREDGEAARRTIEVNLLGSVLCGSEALRHMKAQGYGSIVNTSSRAQSGIRSSAVYAATKGAIASLTYSWALDVYSYGVRVNAVAPTARGTGTRRKSEVPRDDTPTPAQMAPLVRYLLSDASAGVTGQVIRMGGTEEALSIGLMSHPRTGLLAERQGGWSVEAIDGLFKCVLMKRLEPVGAGPMSVASERVGPDTFRLWESAAL